MVAPMLLTPAVQAVLGAVATKGVGSVCRMHDYAGADPVTYHTTIAREGMILTSTTLFSIAFQKLFSTTFPKLIKRFPATGKYEILLRAMLTVPALFAAEGIGRFSFPVPNWRDGHPVDSNQKGLSFESKAEIGIFSGLLAVFAGMPWLQKMLHKPGKEAANVIKPVGVNVSASVADWMSHTGATAAVKLMKHPVAFSASTENPFAKTPRLGKTA